MRLRLLLALFLVVGVAACGAMSTSGRFSSEAGATAGGAQDIGLARKKVAEGIVPAPDDFVAEGLYSEHDLPIAGAPCTQTLCLRMASAIAPNVDTAAQESFVQLGLSSNIDLANFRRRPLDVAIVIDHSGSMSGPKMDAAKAAADKLVDLLDENDLLTVVEFDQSANVLIGPEAVTNRDRFHQQIARIREAGGTCIECGLKEGYEKVRSRQSPDRASRVLLLTDAMPNVGATGEGQFMDLVRTNAERGIELTAFGVGIDFGQTLVTAMTSVRGANYFFLEDAEKTRKVFDEDFDMLVTPIAYDLQVKLTPGQGQTLAAVYGIPGVAPAAAEASFNVTTVFLSRRRGAIVARLSGTPVPQQALASATLSFAPVGGDPATESLETLYAGPADLPADATWFSDSGVRKTVALTNFILGARKACELFQGGDIPAGKALADRTAELLAAEAAALDDEAVRAEAELAAKLAALMK